MCESLFLMGAARPETTVSRLTAPNPETAPLGPCERTKPAQTHQGLRKRTKPHYASRVRIDVVGAVAVSNGDLRVAGGALGGRRARVVLVALALAGQAIPAERLAAMVWAGEPPPTWQPALRGVIRALRTALSPIGLGEQNLITTEPAGYALHPAATTDLGIARASLIDAESHPTDALRLALPASALNGRDLLPAEDADWLRPQRSAVDQLKLRAVEVILGAARSEQDHHRALAAARDLLDQHPLDERAHRILIGALDQAGDRAGAVQAFDQCRMLLAEELGIDPSADTVNVYLHALRADSPTVGARLPNASGAFVGRRVEHLELQSMTVHPGVTTVTGRGGIGKSRLALVAARAHNAHEQQALWVSLANTVDDELVVSQVALELGLTIGDADAVDTLAAHLAPLGRIMIVIDGCEQVADGVASLVSALVTGCPSLTILVTARSALGLYGEQVLHLDPLPAIDPLHVGDSEQIRLLAARVGERGAELTVDDDNAAQLIALCQRCAGLPLALELVAAQLTVMSPADLLDELTAGPATGDQLTALLDRSYALLGPDEAAVLRRCAVLGGPASLALIRAVVSNQDVPPVRIVRILRELTDRGLLSVDRSGPRWRYRQEDDIQRFVAERMTGTEQQTTFGRLADAVRALLPQDAKAPPGPFKAAVAEITGSIRSLLAAAVDGRAGRDSGLELAFRLHRYWAATDVTEGRFWFGRLLDGAPPSPWTGLANFAYGYLTYWTGDAEGALPILDAAVRQLRTEHDDYAARALIYLGGIADDLDHGEQAVEYVKESIEVAERIGDHNLYVGAAMGVGAVLGERGDPVAADYALKALDSCRANASPEQLAAALPTAVMICWQVGALPQARVLLTEGLRLHPDGRRIARVVLLSAATGIALADHDVPAAVAYGQTADEEATALGVERELPLIRCLLARALLADGQLDAAADRARAALHAARALTYRHPLALCLETVALIATQADPTDRAALVATAAELRRRGDRPVIPSLRDPELITPGAPAISVPTAVELASTMLTLSTGTVQHAKGIV